MNLLKLVAQPDIRAHPFRALWRRAHWRKHWWSRPDRPLVIVDWWRGLDIILPRSGSAAQIFYRTFSSRATMEAMIAHLREGMAVVDIGAHAGEYTLVASRLVGPEGVVISFEPQPVLADVIRQNAARNSLANVRVYEQAVAACSGEVRFAADPRSMGGWIAQGGEVSVAIPCTTLDTLASHDCPWIDLIKIDAAGNELAVLRGGETVLGSQRPVILCKLYHPAVVRERFGYDAYLIRRSLTRYGYRLFLLHDGPDRPTNQPFVSLDQLRAYFDRGMYCVTILASKP